MTVTSRDRSPVVGDAPPLDLPDGGLLGAIVRLNLQVTQVLESIASARGLAFADYMVLGVVRRSPGERSSPTAIANVLDRTTGGMSLTLDRLEAVGLLLRTRDADDGRRVVIELTAEGARLARSVNDALHEWESSLGLPLAADDAVEVLDLVTRVVRAHDA